MLAAAGSSNGSVIAAKVPRHTTLGQTRDYSLVDATYIYYSTTVCHYSSTIVQYSTVVQYSSTVYHNSLPLLNAKLLKPDKCVSVFYPADWHRMITQGV